ncbi:hypothetical protein GCM10025857_32620 [Alicyclobacillus contaminans]|uniref:IDEAL domain-containing protein n=1 Tax=Alicyclobacillus contaminans TaxID=392016 RepID=UPI0003FF5425|nr:IDEAL domain-containing protein [Alicyclobacillus contaminans]GMA51905.1 hypothetical protein GCM10025857_32620 [Alicyclobacillus contaminans]
MVLELLRSLLIDWALDTKDKALFEHLTSENWEQYVVSEHTDANNAPDSPRRMVLKDRRGGRLAVYRFPAVGEPVIFVIPETDWDDRGWRDIHGFTFYDRLRSAGYRTQAMWVPMDTSEYTELCSRYRVVHPRQLNLSLPDRRCTLTNIDTPSNGSQPTR